MADYGLTKLQVAIMNVLWTRGEATLAEIQEAIRPDRPLARSTVATLLSRLEKKGVVIHRTEGRQYVYRAAAEVSRVQQSVLSELAEITDGLFEGDVTELVTQLLSDREVSAVDLARMREMIERKEAELRKEGGGV